jgi:hypothetical protein
LIQIAATKTLVKSSNTSEFFPPEKLPEKHGFEWGVFAAAPGIA